MKPIEYKPGIYVVSRSSVEQRDHLEGEPERCLWYNDAHDIARMYRAVGMPAIVMIIPKPKKARRK